jgi:V/A-type H+-transporting ATPase subunit I
MIVRMSKVQIAGPRGLMEEALEFLEEAGDFQTEAESTGLSEKDMERLRRPPAEGRAAAEKAVLDALRRKFHELLGCLPRAGEEGGPLEPSRAVRDLAGTVDGHLADCRMLLERKKALEKEAEDLRRHSPFLRTVGRLLEGVRESGNLEFVALSLRRPEDLPRVRELFSRMTKDRFELISERAPDGTEVLLAVLPREEAGAVRAALHEERLPELSFPSRFARMKLPEKVAYVTERLSQIRSEWETVNGELLIFSRRWRPVYREARDWLLGRLALLGAATSVFRTDMCFLLYGWMPSEDAEPLRVDLERRFGGAVVLREEEIREEDVDRVPVLLRNPPYFQPFELFTRLLPLPRYTSYDPTPFLGIFFPLFFGMMLGDAGYGLLLMGVSLWMAKRFRARPKVRAAFRILLVSALYAVVFGALYGEFLGGLGHNLFGLEPLWMSRREAVLPMLAFALAVGVFHVLFGLSLAFVTALRRGRGKEAAYRLFSVLAIAAATLFAASALGLLPELLQKPLLLTVLVLVPLMVITGGLLTPLELLKSIGNIISYARIMAIGLASVLLAYAANRLGGICGDIVVGILVGALLHAVNIVLGVFSPAIHSIRLHYVEFFGKFLEHGGKKFEPLHKPQEREAETWKKP